MKIYLIRKEKGLLLFLINFGSGHDYSSILILYMMNMFYMLAQRSRYCLVSNDLSSIQKGSKSVKLSPRALLHGLKFCAC